MLVGFTLELLDFGNALAPTGLLGRTRRLGTGAIFGGEALFDAGDLGQC